MSKPDSRSPRVARGCRPLVVVDRPNIRHRIGLAQRTATTAGVFEGDTQTMRASYLSRKKTETASWLTAALPYRGLLAEERRARRASS